MSQDRYNELRQKYNQFTYKSYNVEDIENKYILTYHFEISGLESFYHVIEIYKKDIVNCDIDILNNLVFSIGMIELVSYWKSACPNNVYIECANISNEQIKWFKKVYYHGLGEFFYLNGITDTLLGFMNITCNKEKQIFDKIKKNFKPNGNLIPIGGGKDSTVSLELLKNKGENIALLINPKEPSIECANIAGLEYIRVNRIIDKNLIRLNKEGYLNGHTPFSAMVAFVSYLVSYLTNKEYIVLSNEGSANQSTVIGTNINHQYSKTIEFENDFRDYAFKFLGGDIKYFSMLRVLNEFQIAMLFSKYKKYHSVFKSCNVGSKSVPWVWCGRCPKCLFVYMILYPFLTKEEMFDIFNKDLYDDVLLKETFLELLGYADTKPFECVGTIEEARYSVSLAIKNIDGKLPCLLEYYKNNYDVSIEMDLKHEFNEENNLDELFINIVQEELKKYD